MAITYLKRSPKTSSTDDTKTREIEAILNPKMLKEEGTREKPPTKEAIKFLKDNHPYQWELQKLRKKEGREAWEQKSCYRPGQWNN